MRPGGRTDREADKQTDRQTEGRKDREKIFRNIAKAPNDTFCVFHVDGKVTFTFPMMLH